MNPGRKLPPHMVGPLSLAAMVALGLSAPGATHGSDLSDLTLEELTRLEITTASRRAQNANDVAAAVFVITQDDIRRAGARSIPEALRLAPGLQVGQIDSSRWAITTRGFNGRFANKLLVLMDGRTLYTPSFSGVYWDVQDTLIEDIERIEVIRGPAGTIWGSNAVNGIINIISKNASQTDGLSVNAEGTQRGSAGMSVRYGSADDPDHAWRAYAKFTERQENELLYGGTAHDDARQVRGGARADLQLSPADAVSVSAEAYDGHSGQTLSSTLLAPLLASSVGLDRQEDVDGAWAMASWTRTRDSGSTIELQTYIDHARRAGEVYTESRDTADLQLQYNIARQGRHTVMWGLNARLNRDDFDGTTRVDMQPVDATYWLFSAYGQAESAWLDDHLHVTAGARLEDSEYGGAAFLPSLRAQFAISDTASLWWSIARGERRPSRAEADIHVHVYMPVGSPSNPLPRPISVTFAGNEDFRSEQLWAYETGWRWQPGEDFTLDVATFFNDFDRLRAAPQPVMYCMPASIQLLSDPACMLSAQSIEGLVQLTNPIDGYVYGGELLMRWAPVRNWRLTGTYSLLKKHITGTWSASPVAMFHSGEDPESQFSLRSTLSLGPAWDWDVVMRRVDTLLPSRYVNSYTEATTRLAWRPTPTWSIALVGSNLLHDSQLEAVSELSDILPTKIERSIGLQVRWSSR